MVLKRQLLLLRLTVWVGAATPLLWLAWRMFPGGGLGVDPTQELTDWSGISAVVLLLCSLAVTPIRRLTGWNVVQKVRRLLGLWAFFYATVHLLVYLVLDQGLGWSFIVEDVLTRPFTLVGALAFLMLLPLALTSTKGWIRRLGKRWTRLHRLVYPAAILAVLHFELGQKTDFTTGPILTMLALAVLLGFRVWSARQKPAD